ncbi:retrovirus-related pol polyprotein from transposon TNT 1-94 [Tanacetum coccineum]
MIPIVIHGILPPRLRHTITKLCLFFNMIHSKVIDPEKLDEWQRDIILTLCQLEMYFPPFFFDVMVHLVSHIVGEIKARGLVFLHYMYPFERYMGFLKGYVRNRPRPKESIVEGCVLEEVVSFCTSYIDGIPDIGIPESRHEDSYSSDPFILAKQATQIFYVEDPSNTRWNIVIHSKRHIVSVEEVVDEDEYNQFDELPPFSIGIQSVDEVLDNTIYLRSDHQEGHKVED